MIVINVDSVPAEVLHKRDVIADCGARGPMSQQHAADSHGHEMHPQRLVQLVGCHDPNAGKHEGAHRCTGSLRRAFKSSISTGSRRAAPGESADGVQFRPSSTS
jgi:hypothetical protein